MPFLIQCATTVTTQSKLKWIIWHTYNKSTKDTIGKEGNIVISKSSDSAGDNVDLIKPKKKFGQLSG